ncbi:hypothetical protein Celaphus_00018097, partial [Cervus elaphus hippelaphus]
MASKQVSGSKCFGGLQKVFEHDSVELKCKMKFAVYLSPKAETGKCPNKILYQNLVIIKLLQNMALSLLQIPALVAAILKEKKTAGALALMLGFLSMILKIFGKLIIEYYKRVMIIATTLLQPLLLITSDIMQNTRMHEKLQIRESLQDYKI